GIGDGRRASADWHGTAIHVHENLSRCVAADHDGVIAVVAEYRKQPSTGKKRSFDRRFGSHDLNPRSQSSQRFGVDPEQQRAVKRLALAQERMRGCLAAVRMTSLTASLSAA